ncbi:hypothetical protein ACLOJK_032545 [Asimina triloba]
MACAFDGFGNWAVALEALERRRESTSIRSITNHSPVPLPSTPPRQELQNSELLSPHQPHQDKESDPLLNVSDLPTSPAVAKSSLLPIEDPRETLPPSEGLALGNKTLTTAEKKCEELIDEFQYVVTENLKRIERRTLMSMR